MQAKTNELEAISDVGHTHELWAQIKGKAGRILGCDGDEVAYKRNTTEGANIVCNGLKLKRGDEVITTTHEHIGNTVVWLARQKRDGIVVKTFTPSTASASENIERIAALITPNTRALSISHVTCATGQVLPVKEIGVDGAQAPGMMPVDVRAIGLPRLCHEWAQMAVRAEGHGVALRAQRRAQ
jgi:selenocysteine lyase/cysteine desulfurase